MHERSVVRDIIREAGALANEYGGSPTLLRVTIGALSGISPAAFRRQFSDMSAGSNLAGAELVVEVSDDLSKESALGVVLDAARFAGE